MITTPRRELREIDQFLTEWPEIGGAWIHFATSEQQSVNRLIDDSISLASSGRNVLELDFSLQLFQSRFDVRKLIRRLIDRHELLQKFMNSITPQLQAFYQHALESDQLTGLFDEKDHWEPILLQEMLQFLAVKSRLTIVLRDLPRTQSPAIRSLIMIIGSLRALPVLIMTSGIAEIGLTGFADQTIVTPGKLSVKEAQHIVARQLRTGKINSQLITNTLYIKSGGQEERLRFMVEGYGRPIISDRSEEVVSREHIQSLRASDRIEKVFSMVLSGMDGHAQRILAFLCRMDDPLPKMYFQIILRHYAISRKTLNSWLEAGLINRKRTLGDDFFVIEWLLWRDYLRKHTSIEQLESLLDIYKDRLNWKDIPRAFMISHLFAETGDFATAIKFAYFESGLLVQNGDIYRALERLAFIRRNLERYPNSSISETELLTMTASAQQAAGLSENVFESFRSLRELQRADSRDEWLQTSLSMARTLFEMDALAESRYLLKDLAARSDNPPALQAEIALLSGELEENSGHPEYALRQYETAISLVDVQSSPIISFHLYHRLKNLYADLGKTGELQHLIESMALQAGTRSPLGFFLQLELATFLISENRRREALTALISVMRSGPFWLSPRLKYQFHFQIADLYAYFGKWYLSRYHLKQLQDAALLMTTTRQRAEVLLNLAIVHKETGAYRRALDLLDLLERLELTGKLEQYAYLAQLHRGHLYLLVRNPMRARESLLKCLVWAREERNDEITLQSLLFLCSYQIHHGQSAKAKDYLNEAEELLPLLSEKIDHLNAGYYRLQLLMSDGQYGEALTLATEWAGKCQGIIKMEMIAQLMLGRLHTLSGNVEEARSNLDLALASSRRYRLSYLEFLVLKSIAKLQKTVGGSPEVLKRAVEEANLTFRVFLNNIGDEILQKQIEESSEYDSLTTLLEF